MLTKVALLEKQLKDYKELIPNDLYAEIQELAAQLKGLSVAHVNATSRGGGVAEILSSLTPLMRDVGIDANWYIIPTHDEFFNVLLTKKLHLALQGSGYELSPRDKESYDKASKILADMASELKPDIWVMHDPQPLGSAKYLRNGGRGKILRMHIDLSHPHPDAWQFLNSYVDYYNKAVFHIQDFVPADFPRDKKVVFPPAIDPLVEKNQEMDPDEAYKVVSSFGINPAKPLIANISRFDPLKDPIGMIDAYYKAKREIPDLQLAIVGFMLASDDPDAAEVFTKVQKHAKGDPDIYLFADPSRVNMGVGTFVRAFQTAADIIIHKSLYEGFGLVVTEAMWKEKPVIASNAGGLKLQIQHGKNGYLVNSVDEAAQYITQLMKNPKLRREIGKAAKETVREKFLLPRLLRDYLKLFTELL